MNWGDGHTVVVVPVPELEPFVLERTRFYDTAWVSPDPTFTHAHVTLLAPWVPAPTTRDLQLLAGIADRNAAFDFRLERVDEFPDGTIHLPAEPRETFMNLMRDVSVAFPDLRPYAGAFGSVEELTPHLTLDRRSATVDLASTQSLAGDLIPVTCRADRLEVHRYAAHECAVEASFRLS